MLAGGYARDLTRILEVGALFWGGRAALFGLLPGVCVVNVGVARIPCGWVPLRLCSPRAGGNARPRPLFAADRRADAQGVRAPRGRGGGGGAAVHARRDAPRPAARGEARVVGAWCGGAAVGTRLQAAARLARARRRRRCCHASGAQAVRVCRRDDARTQQGGRRQRAAAALPGGHLDCRRPAAPLQAARDARVARAARRRGVGLHAGGRGDGRRRLWGGPCARARLRARRRERGRGARARPQTPARGPRPPAPLGRCTPGTRLRRLKGPALRPAPPRSPSCCAATASATTCTTSRSPRARARRRWRR